MTDSEDISCLQRMGSIGFAASSVLPGEDRLQFAEFAKGLFLRYEAQGALEEDAIRTMAEAIWRKQHLSIFKLAAQSRALYGHLFQFPNDQDGFRKEGLQGIEWVILRGHNGGNACGWGLSWL
jgi:hypothetical protein